VDFLFTLVTISFVVQSFLVSYSSICQFFLLVTEPLSLFLGSCCLYLHFAVYSLLFPVPVSRLCALLRSLIHFKLKFVQGKWHESSFSLLYPEIQFSQQHLLKKLSFLYLVLDIFVKNQVRVAVWIYVWVFFFSFLLGGWYL
jgi:hypothetical protein